jgi:hypothetical protein
MEREEFKKSKGVDEKNARINGSQLGLRLGICNLNEREGKGILGNLTIGTSLFPFSSNFWPSPIDSNFSAPPLMREHF